METFDPDEIKRWDPRSQERAVGLIEQALAVDPEAWYCKRGRRCDGKPHDDYDYKHARGDQWPPPGTDWFVWLIMSGRGAGKTRTGAEWIRWMSTKVPHIAAIGQTVKHVRQVMVQGESGLEYVCRRARIGYTWEPSKREFTFENGAKVSFYSAEEPDALRGPQHGLAWLDEPAHFDNIEEVWDNLLLGLRNLGPVDPKILCTSTPLPTAWLKELREDEGTRTVVVSSYVNRDNLAPIFVKKVLGKFEGTRKGRQEVHGELLEDVEGAMWSWGDIEPHRTPDIAHTTMDRIVVGVDPAGSSNTKSDETGIIVAAQAGNDYYVFADGSGTMRPDDWATAAMNLYDHYESDAVVPEKNYGGEMVEATLRNVDQFPAIKPVNSRRGKKIRAEPIVALYQQGRVHHVGEFPGLEKQMTEWVPTKGDSPDRVDALVHALTELAKPTDDEDVAISTPRGIITRGGPERAEYLGAVAQLRLIHGGSHVA